jgi:hypothetical protein
MHGVYSVHERYHALYVLDANAFDILYMPQDVSDTLPYLAP